MNIEATFQGNPVSIVDIDANGSSVYITYLDAANDLKRSLLYSPELTDSLATNAVIASGAGGVCDHSLLSGLLVDDHPQYHTDTRGDVRYYTKAELGTTNVLYVAKNGNDANGGDIADPFENIQTAITYAIANCALDVNNSCEIRIAPGVYTESITSFNEYIYLIGLNVNMDDISNNVVLYNTGVDEAHWPLNYTGAVHLQGMTLRTNPGGEFGKISKYSMFRDCNFEEGHFIDNADTTGTLYMQFKECSFHSGSCFSISGSATNKKMIAIRNCDFFDGTNMVFGGGLGHIKFQDSMCANPITTSGGWDITYQNSELYGSNGKINFGSSTGDIFVYNSILPNGLHFYHDTSGDKTINNNTFRGLVTNIPLSGYDITADEKISIVNYSGNEQYAGLCACFEIAGPNRHVGGSFLDRYHCLECAISSIPASSTGVVHIHENLTGLAPLSLNTESDVTIKGNKQFSLAFTGDIVTVGYKQNVSFHDLSYIDGGKMEINGDYAYLGFEGCLTAKGYIVTTSGANSMVLSYYSSIQSISGYPALSIDNLDTLCVIGYSRLKGYVDALVGQPAILLNVDNIYQTLKAKYSTFIHGRGSSFPPISRTGSYTSNILTYACAGNADLSPTGVTNDIGGSNNTSDANLLF